MLPLLLALTAGATLGQQIPSWTGPFLDPLVPYGGASFIANTTWTRLMFATTALGTYNMSPMMAYFQGWFLASWKNSPVNEDQPGQRILYSQSTDGVVWTPTDGTNVLFPNVSTNSNPAALFAEPALIINGRMYAAASPIQFCLYPDAYFDRLLLRRVFLNGTGQFGPLFWAADSVPAGFEEASAALGIVPVTQMDALTRADIAQLASPEFRPCGPDANSTKCEWCEGGCQSWNATANITSLENERTHYVVPHTRPQVDVLLYRSHANRLFTGVRYGLDGPWQPIVATNISDDVANLNAGSLPDGRVYLISNAMLNVFRDPLFMSIAQDGWHFSQTYVVASCEQSVFASPPEQPWGCLYRYSGGAKEGGMQYPQGMVVSDAAVAGMYVIFSMNKEDIWVARLPLTF